jgi:hypothetical protein
MHRRPGLKSVCLLLGALAGCGMLMMRLASAPSRSLLTAEKLPPMKNFLGSNDVVYRHPLSDPEALVGKTRFIPASGTPTPFWQPPLRSVHLFRRDLLSGEESPLPALDPVFAKDYMALYVTSFSPNGQWLLCGLASPGAPSAYTVCRPDGTHFQRWERAPVAGRFVQPIVYANAHVQWLPDSQRWIEFRDSYRGFRQHIGQTLTVHDVRTPDVMQTLPIAPTSPLVTQRYDFDRDCKVVSPTRLLMAVDRPAPGGASDERQSLLLELDPSAGGTLVRALPIPLPTQIVSNGISTLRRFSPSGNQILWVIPRRKISPVAQLLHRLHPAYVPDHALCTEIWVSRTDGSHLQEVGSMDMLDPEITVAPPVYQIYEAGWMPDEKRIWYCCHNSPSRSTTFYTLPLE